MGGNRDGGDGVTRELGVLRVVVVVVDTVVEELTGLSWGYKQYYSVCVGWDFM